MYIEKNVSEVGRTLFAVLMVVLLCSYLILCMTGISSWGFSKDGIVALRVILPLVALGALFVNKIYLRMRWLPAAVLSIEACIEPGLAIGAFFGAKDFLHLNWTVAMLLALPPTVLFFVKMRQHPKTID